MGERDIVDRLENDGSSWAQELFNEAAATIRRLRFELEDTKADYLRRHHAAVDYGMACRLIVSHAKDLGECKGTARAAIEAVEKREAAQNPLPSPEGGRS